jgi:hypothetical protein
MPEDKQNTDKNRVILTGTLTKIESGTTTQSFPFVNIVVQSVGLKYTDNIPCVVYGATATRLLESTKAGDVVTVYGRVREKTTNGKTFISIVVTSVKKSI